MTDVGLGSIASDQSSHRLRRISPSSPIASKLWHRSETTQSARRRHMHCSKLRSIRSPRGRGEQLRWHVEAKRVRGLEVDHQLLLVRRPGSANLAVFALGASSNFV